MCRRYRSSVHDMRCSGESQRQSLSPWGRPSRKRTSTNTTSTRWRVRKNFRVNNQQLTADEDFEISVRNRKKTPVEVRVVEHLYRWTNWKITQNSDDFKKTDSQTIEFRVPVPADGEKKVTYSVHYW